MEGGAQGEQAIMEAAEADREGVREAISLGFGVERVQVRHLGHRPGADGRAPTGLGPPVDEPSDLQRGLYCIYIYIYIYNTYHVYHIIYIRTAGS
jgi:hypothetical protein